METKEIVMKSNDICRTLLSLMSKALDEGKSTLYFELFEVYKKMSDVELKYADKMFSRIKTF